MEKDKNIYEMTMQEYFTLRGLDSSLLSILLGQEDKGKETENEK